MEAQPSDSGEVDKTPDGVDSLPGDAGILLYWVLRTH